MDPLDGLDQNVDVGWVIPMAFGKAGVNKIQEFGVTWIHPGGVGRLCKAEKAGAQGGMQLWTSD